MAIAKLLVANRGEIALRVLRTAHAMGITTVAVFSDGDVDAPYVTQADESVHLPGDAPADTYLDVAKVVDAARVTGADAVHPGYGFLSENATFARACADAGLLFVGPPPTVIEQMGSKIAAKRLLGAAGVPVLPSVTFDESGVDVAAVEREVGFPVLVKASHGGGGRGMRVVREPGELADAVTSAQREAAAAFGDGTVFVERYLDAPRHIEVQILGDLHGNVVHVFERECSVQRRYQKIVEEAPSPAVDDTLREALGAAAVAAGKAIGYVGAGTVEFVLDRDGRFYFLEVNTRLQVEHPVTELVTGLDLVRVQLLVAAGHPLPAEVLSASVDGHAVEARLYAEDVAAGFLPATGTLHRFAVPDLPGVRVDAGVADGSVVGVHYDPMLAKVIAYAPTREDACRKLARALAGTAVHGVVTNRDLLVGILREPGFLAGDVDTGYLTRHDPQRLAAGAREPGADTVHAAVAALAGQAERRASAPVLATIPSGWRNVPSSPQRVAFEVDGERLDVTYVVGTPAGAGLAGVVVRRVDVGGTRQAGVAVRRVDVGGTRQPGVAVRRADVGGAQQPGGTVRRVNAEVTVAGAELSGVVVRRVGVQVQGAVARSHVDLEVAGVRRVFGVHRVGDTYYVDSAMGHTTLVEVPRFPEPGSLVAPGSLLAPMPGTVVRVAVEVGAYVTAGTPMVVLEAMKMEHGVDAPHDGVVTEVGVTVGEAVDVGTVLAVVEVDG